MMTILDIIILLLAKVSISRFMKIS
ncbi:hypothetical protein MTR67_041689 [Solanum verrucosum]|uniref:Uncharacterized protein n=1 Tax=Solanum verrucosum TaxID=315347 RepID=A0AAF0ZTF4_SOLVR|nr:hypothetical protein MTR67_041689 [Solanum verrucosum]